MKPQPRLGLGSAQNWNLALNFGGVLAERIVRLLAGLVVTSLVARSLGIEGFGLYNLGLSLGAMGLTVASLGLDGVMVREIARRPHRTEAMLRLVGWWRLGAGIVMLGACAGYAAATGVAPLTMVLLASGSVGAALAGPGLVFQATGRARLAAFWQTVVFLVASVVRMALASSNASLLVFAVVVAAEVLANGGVLWLVWKKRAAASSRARVMARGLVQKLGRKLWREGWPWWLAAISISIYMRFDQILLHHLGGAEELGAFAAASRLTEQAQLLPVALAVPMLGRLARIREEAERRRVVEAYLAASAGAGWACAAGTVIVGPWVIGVIFGAEYSEAVGVALLQALAMPFIFVGVARAQALVVQGRAVSGLGATLSAALLSLALNLLLIPRIGALGAAAAACAAQIVSSWLTSYAMPGARWMADAQTRALCSPARAWRRAWADKA